MPRCDRQPGDVTFGRSTECRSKLFFWTHWKAGAPVSFPSHAVATGPRNAASAASATALLQVMCWVSVDYADSFPGACAEALGAHKSRLDAASTGERVCR